MDVGHVKELEHRRKSLQIKTQQLQNERNTKSKMIGQAKARGEDATALLSEMSHFGEELKTIEQELEALEKELTAFYLAIPNLPNDSVPIGQSEQDNEEVRRYGKLPIFNFEVKDHVELGKRLKLLDFDMASKLSGARFVVMYDALARLHRALIQFMLDLHTETHGYKESLCPLSC